MSALISLHNARTSSLASSLELLDDEALLVWTIHERSCVDSPLSPFWALFSTDPLSTGLTMPVDALEAAGSVVLSESFRLRDEATRQFTAVKAKLQSTPLKSIFTWDAYCGALELWQAYGVSLLLPGADCLSTALLPLGLLMNHSLTPHVTRFSTFDEDGVLRLRTCRDIAAGEEVFLSYGRLPNADLLTFYGFALPDNPYDVLPVSIEVEEDTEAALKRAGLSADFTFCRGSSLPVGALEAMRVILDTESDREALDALQAILEGLREGLGDASKWPFCSLFVDGQRAIINNALMLCASE